MNKQFLIAMVMVLSLVLIVPVVAEEANVISTLTECPIDEHNSFLIRNTIDSNTTERNQYSNSEDYDTCFDKKKYSFSFALYLDDTLRIWKEDHYGNPVTVKSYKSSKTSVARIVDEGDRLCIYPRSEGKSTIEAKTSNGYRIKIKLSVKDPYKPISVRIPSSLTLTVGDTYVITPVLSPSNARTTYSWSTSKKKVVTVSGGMITAHAKGSAKITVKTANGKKATCKVKVEKRSSSSPTTQMKDLSVYLGKDLTESAYSLGLYNRVQDTDSWCVYYEGNNIILTANNTIVTDGGTIDQVSITGPCDYNLYGFTYGILMDYAKTKLNNDGWLYIEEYNGSDGHTLYYERGNIEIALEIEDERVSSITVNC